MATNQLTDTILMITPTLFGFNEETTDDNVFMKREPSKSEKQIRNTAMKEFDAMVDRLEKEGIHVIVCPSPENAYTPDAVFPNNWISFHPSHIVLYPMKAPTRRMERQWEQVKKVLKQEINYPMDQEIVDLTSLEEKGSFLEGTGSLVFDRLHHVAFASLSQRTNLEGLNTFIEKMGYQPVIFHAVDRNSKEVYHTNVVMSVGEHFAVVCFEAIPNKMERDQVRKKLESLGKEIVVIALDPMHAFCGNILQLVSNQGPKIVMSETALHAFTPTQREILEKHGKLVAVDISQIETTGGGSARCMMAEIFR